MINKVVTAVTEANISFKTEEEDCHNDECNGSWYDEPFVKNIEPATNSLIILKARVHWKQHYSKSIDEDLKCHYYNEDIGNW